MDSKPLAGKRLVITRPPKHAREMVPALEGLGAEVLLLPTVEFAPPEDGRELDEALSKLPSFDAILFLSRNAVRYFFNRCHELGVKGDRSQSAKCMIAAVGSGTAQEIISEGWRVDFVPQVQTGEALVRELGDRVAGKKVLLPRSNRGDQSLPKALREAGAHLTEVAAYRTVLPQTIDQCLLARIRAREVDAMIFASPSAFHNFAECLGADELANLSGRIQFAAIGSTTAAAIRSAGVPVAIEAVEPSAESLARAILTFYQSQAAKVRPA
jgi:uroporphyrinogen III methyltransferase / synthase